MELTDNELSWPKGVPSALFDSTAKEPEYCLRPVVATPGLRLTFKLCGVTIPSDAAQGMLSAGVVPPPTAVPEESVRLTLARLPSVLKVTVPAAI